MAEKSPELDPYAHELEMRQQRQQWEERRRAESEQRRREALQEELAGYLRRRSRDWADLTGSEPGAEDLRRWQQEFAERRENEYQRERQKKLQEAERLSGF